METVKNHLFISRRCGGVQVQSPATDTSFGCENIESEYCMQSTSVSICICVRTNTYTSHLKVQLLVPGTFEIALKCRGDAHIGHTADHSFPACGIKVTVADANRLDKQMRGLSGFLEGWRDGGTIDTMDTEDAVQTPVDHRQCRSSASQCCGFTEEQAWLQITRHKMLHWAHQEIIPSDVYRTQPVNHSGHMQH